MGCRIRSRRRGRFAVLVVVALGWGIPAAASAQDAGACVPSCRTGFVCLSGQCVSACNPPCAAGTVCSANAQCLPEPAPVQASPAGYPPPNAAPPGAYGYYPPPVAYYPPAPPPRGVHLHDGFFLRLGTGFSYTSLEFSDDSMTGSIVSGPGMAIDVTIGGAVRPGLILAGSMSGGMYPEPNVDPTGGGASTTAENITLQNTRATFLIDYYPNPQGGFHFGGDIGISILSTHNNQTMTMSQHDPAGVTGGGHVGYELWISDQWSLGGMFKLGYAHMWRGSGVGYEAFEVGGLQPQLVGAFTFN